MINATLQADENERKDAISKAKAVVAFNLKNDAGKEEAWHLDLKEKGIVAKGAAPAGGKADGTPFQLIHAVIWDMVLTLDSHVEPLRQRLPGPGHRQGERAAVVHGRQAEDPREYHEGDQDGACA